MKVSESFSRRFDSKKQTFFIVSQMKKQTSSFKDILNVELKKVKEGHQ